MKKVLAVNSVVATIFTSSLLSVAFSQVVAILLLVIVAAVGGFEQNAGLLVVLVALFILLDLPAFLEIQTL